MENNNSPDYFSNQVLKAKRFYMNLKPKSKDKLSVVSGGCEYCSADYRIDRQDFPYLSIEFVSSGRGNVKLENSEYELTAGTIFSYGPGIKHLISTDVDNKLIKYFIDFTGDQAALLLDNIHLKPGKIIQTSSINIIINIFEELINNGQNNSPYSRRICSLLLEYLLLKIAETSIAYGHRNSLAYETYRRCRKKMEDNFLKSKKLEQLADECNINIAYLCRLFKRFDHKSPYQYILQLKMAYAAEKLSEPETSIKQIAYDLNFSDAFHFSRVFKSYFGVPPRNFIKLRR